MIFGELMRTVNVLKVLMEMDYRGLVRSVTEIVNPVLEKDKINAFPVEMDFINKIILAYLSATHH